MANNLNYQNMIKKYRDIVKTKTAYDITEGFDTPTMGEMIEEDLAYDAMMQIVNSIDGSGDPSLAAFYIDAPYSDTLGYHEDVHAFVVDATVKKEMYNDIDVSWIWNKCDGDTISFYLKDLNAGSEPFTIAGRKYNSIQEYYWGTYKDTLSQSHGDTNVLSISPAQNADGLQFSIRYVGIDTAEVPHFEPMALSPDHNKVITKTIGEIKNKPSQYVYVKHPVVKENNSFVVKKRKDSDSVKMINVDGVYKEILPVNNKTLEPLPFGSNYKDSDYIIPNNKNINYKEGTVSYLIVASDESTSDKVVDAYNAKMSNKKVLDLTSGKVRLVLDSHALTFNEIGSISGEQVYYGSAFYTGEVLAHMLKQYKRSTTDLRLQGLSYSLFGADTYSRMLGAVYTKTQEGKWINVNKFVYATTDHTINQKDYNDTQISGANGGLSDAFKVWTYDKENILWLDSLEELSKKSYELKMNLHKQLSGLDNCDEQMRNYTVMIGDCLFMIPPTSIRSVTHTQYEKQPLLRSKGTMVKGGYQNERVIELELYFAGDEGINGIPMEHKFPSGDKTTYYMNGLRSLISQFKFTPFLPVENTYINDVLGIEAVSMLGLAIQTVPEYPGLLKVILTLQDFNYRLYMPDLPIGIEQAIDVPTLAETTPVFAMSFQWEAFRYYYQRSIIAGEDLYKIAKESGYNSTSYNNYLYSMRTCLQPTTACGSSIEFYVPEKEWLDNALKIKKDRDKAGVSFDALELTDNIKNVSKEIGKILDSAQQMDDAKSTFSQKLQTICENEKLLDLITWSSVKVNYWGHDDKYAGGKSYLTSRIPSAHIPQESVDVIDLLVKPVHDAVGELLDHKSMYTTTVLSSEEMKSDGIRNAATYYLHCDLKLDLSVLSDNEKSILKEYLSVDTSIEKDSVLPNDSLRFTLTVKFGSASDNNRKITDISWGTNITKLLRTFKRIGDGEVTMQDYENDLANTYDYRDPSKMLFVPYMDKILVTDISLGFNNTFTTTNLKAVDGPASQYLGGTDAMLEVKMITCDEVVVSALNTLPAVVFDTITHYRQILPCTPLRIKNEIAQMCGINEVLIEMLSIDTIPEYPGAYEITMRLSSVDRTLRQRETMRKLDINKNGGFVGQGNGGSKSIKTYFETDKLLSQAELYPDLELPTLDDLRARGYGYIRYVMSSQYRVYPDPDFYMVYGNGYTAAKIKKILEDNFAALNEDNSTLENIQLDDTENKLSLYTKIDDVMGLTVMSQCENSDKLDEALHNIMLEVHNNRSGDINAISQEAQHKDLEAYVKFLLSTNMTDGWKLKPGYQAPLCDAGINEAITKLPRKGSSNEGQSNASFNHAASEVKVIRTKAIQYIDKILAKPIELRSSKNGKPTMPSSINPDKILIAVGGVSESHAKSIEAAIDKEYDKLFVSDSDGAALIKLLNPFNIESLLIEDFEKPNMKRFITGFVYAAACAHTGTEAYKGGMFDKGDYKPKILYDYTGQFTKDDKGNYVPLCKVNTKTSPRNASSLEEAVANGYMFGTYCIKQYTSEEIMAMTESKLAIKYVGDDAPLYKAGIKDGFLDPYYNKLDDSSEELKNYKLGILVDPEYAACAYYRILLVWVRKMIYDGLFISDLDVIAKDVYNQFPDGVSESRIEKAQEEINQKNKDSFEISDLLTPLKKLGDFVNPFNDKNDTDYDDTDLYVLLATLSNTLPKSFVSRMVYPVILDLCAGDKSIQTEMLNRNYSALQSITDASMNPSTGVNTPDSQRLFNKFFKALEAIGCLEAGDVQKSWADESQKMMNSVQKQIYIEASNNPKKYVMHSFYDMLMNDKRGRLVRAFPTFYMIVMDEGRKIGYWKLHDNFYNVSAISNIQVTKSRKIPTDTCTITMSNMYSSYAANYSTNTTQQYADVYGIKDAIDNIFSPTTFYQKSEDLRSRLMMPDTVVIKPGARIHVRIGYGSDAARIPVCFNGKIAEVNVGDVVDIVAQGDGGELTNPLNIFGSIEANQLEPSQKVFRAFKNLRGSFTRGGYSPRDLLAEVLSAEYGGKEKVANWAFNGQYFNDNPFGIIHFGDKNFVDIFEQGEVVQNLFEVSDVDFGKGYNELMSEPSTKKSTPIINTSLFDKTFWDLMHMAARAGKDHVCAIRDFGFRSTIFLGRTHDYYAYEYRKENDNIIEKRKPFQQYHYIDSYNDIIYNNMTATESVMKTNATGIWQASGWVSGRKQETVGPVYLDQNIYPEYQKSMTYDTGLLADGNGGFDFKPITKLGETFCEGNENDDKVNKELARRMTISALKDSVKDMYQGEIAILGSPAIKPFDRIELVDIIESMSGAFECESVVHSLNIETGFTTTIMPDVIVRDINNVHEIAVNQIIKTALAPHILTLVVTNGIMHTFFRKQSKIAKALARSSMTQSAAGSINRHAKDLFKSTNIQALDELCPSIGKLASNLGSAVVESSSYMKLNGLKELINHLSDLKLTDTSNIKDIITYMKNFNNIDIDGSEKILQELVEEMSTDTSISTSTVDEIRKSLSELKEIQTELVSGKINFKEPLEELAKHEKLSDTTKKYIEEFLTKNKDGVVKNMDDLKDITKILDRNDVFQHLSSSENATALKKVKQSLKPLQEFADPSNAKGISKFKNLISLKSFDKTLDTIKATKGAGMLLNLAKIVTFAVEIIASEFIIANIKESFMSWFKNIQTLTVYPMKQHDKFFYAGMSGSKGSVYGMPTSDGWNSIQGMVIKAYENLTESNPILSAVSTLVIDFVLGAGDEFEKAANDYKVKLGIIDDDQATAFDIENQVYSNVSKSLMLQGRANDSLKTIARLQSFDGTNKDVTNVFQKSHINNTSKTDALIPVEFDPTISEYIEKDKFGILHNALPGAQDTKVTSQGVSYILKSNQFKNKNGTGDDIPMLRDDSVEVLKLLIEETYKYSDTKDSKIFLKSGTRVKGADWRSTGYQFIIGSTSSIEEPLKSLSNSLNEGKYKVFMWNTVTSDAVETVEGADTNYRITIYPSAI